MESKHCADYRGQASTYSQHQQDHSQNSHAYQNAQNRACKSSNNDQEDAMSLRSSSSWQSAETLVPTPPEQLCQYQSQSQQPRRQPQSQQQTLQLNPQPRRERGCKHLKALEPPQPVIVEKEHKDRSWIGKAFHGLGNFYKWNEWAWKRRKGLIPRT